jgi:hypothetical protein
MLQTVRTTQSIPIVNGLIHAVFTQMASSPMGQWQTYRLAIHSGGRVGDAIGRQPPIDLMTPKIDAASITTFKCEK